MLQLERIQTGMAQALAGGPRFLEPGHFAGPAARVLLAMKAHANSLSHARLKALEESFPLTRQEVGDAAFLALGHGFVAVPETCTRALADIGRGFAEFLQATGHGPTLVDLARAEWTMLQSMLSADAAPLDLETLAGQAPERVLVCPVRLHPAARLMHLSEPASTQLAALGAVRGARCLLFCRPDTAVTVTAATECEAAIINLLDAAGPGGMTIESLFRSADVLRQAETAPADILSLAARGAIASAEIWT